MSIQATSVRNQFKGKVREIIGGDVASEVVRASTGAPGRSAFVGRVASLL